MPIERSELSKAIMARLEQGDVGLDGWWFAQVPIAVICNHALSDGAKTLFGLLIWRQGKNAGAWPSLNSMAEDLGVTPRTIQNRLRELEEHGYLHIRERPGRSNYYRLLASAQAPTKKVSCPPTKEISGGGENNFTQNERKEREKVEQEGTKGAGAPPELPHNLDGWLAFVREGKGEKGGMTARLGRMLITLWPERYNGLDPPYSKIGGVARNVNGASRLAQLLWQANAHKVTGDPLEYAAAMHRRGSGSKDKRSTQDKWEDIDEWAES